MLRACAVRPLVAAVDGPSGERLNHSIIILNGARECLPRAVAFVRLLWCRVGRMHSIGQGVAAVWQLHIVLGLCLHIEPENVIV